MSGYSTAGYSQYQSLCTTFSPISYEIDSSEKLDVKFGIGIITPLEFIIIPMQIGPYNFHIVEVNTLFLLSFKDLDGREAIFDNLKNVMRLKNNVTIPVVRL